MAAKKSIGITVLAWIFIIGGAFGLSGTVAGGKDGFQPAQNGAGAYLFLFSNIILACASIVSGIFLLKLKSWARKLAIALCLVNIALTLFNFRIGPALRKNQEEYEKNKALIIERYKPQYQQQALEECRRTKEAGDRALPVILGFVLVLPIAWSLFVIYYLTRQEVQEQFGENREAEDKGEQGGS